MPSVLTLSACTPPLHEVLELWDFLFAFGVHSNILCIAAQLILMRSKLIDESKPGKLLRQFPDLHAKSIISLTVTLIKVIPSDLYDALVRHSFESESLK